jgi:hypothetical protein
MQPLERCVPSTLVQLSNDGNDDPTGLTVSSTGCHFEVLVLT